MKPLSAFRVSKHVKPGLTHCIKCEYDLAGIPDGDICPECGTANRATLERRVRFVQWNNPRDTILLCLFVLNVSFVTFAMPTFAILPLLLLAAIFVFDSMAVPEYSFGFVRFIKTVAIACGISLLLMSWAVFMLGWAPL